jgi:hypothetical protein
MAEPTHRRTIEDTAPVGGSDDDTVVEIIEDLAAAVRENTTSQQQQTAKTADWVNDPRFFTQSAGTAAPPTPAADPNKKPANMSWDEWDKQRAAAAEAAAAAASAPAPGGEHHFIPSSGGSGGGVNFRDMLNLNAKGEGEAGEAGAEAAGEAGAEGAAEVAGEAAAGPVGAVFAAAKEVAKVFKEIRLVVDDASRSMQDFAHGDNEGGLRKLGDGVANVTEKLAGKVWGELVRDIQAMGRAVGDVTMAFIDRGKQLEGFSGDIATANAYREIAGLMADIKEAETLGPAIAELTDQQTRAEMTTREILLPLKDFIVTHLAQLMKRIADTLDVLKPLTDIAGKILTAGLAPLELASAMLGQVLDAVKLVAAKLGVRFEADDDGDNPLEKLFLRPAARARYTGANMRTGLPQTDAERRQNTPVVMQQNPVTGMPGYR